MIQIQKLHGPRGHHGSVPPPDVHGHRGDHGGCEQHAGEEREETTKPETQIIKKSMRPILDKSKSKTKPKTQIIKKSMRPDLDKCNTQSCSYRKNV